ncbi:hypothetical protein BU26DRAFT_139937 [Trematosphaeria pertusa]|uniref:Uncharacterized protein n=1 Tax=Trematosphaeria pertusa TaxID=390896 RepID=A0A6A6IWX6_9PLEO|nr:uncharacterized protein BU26DRAFT_139937 [Trematosphaeria pertusa]KAF2254537.1 hypothetical protein BU26DRAFT_139937 [Trematosphaeria pertusa]
MSGFAALVGGMNSQIEGATNMLSKPTRSSAGGSPRKPGVVPLGRHFPQLFPRAIPPYASVLSTQASATSPIAVFAQSEEGYAGLGAVDRSMAGSSVGGHPGVAYGGIPVSHMLLPKLVVRRSNRFRAGRSAKRTLRVDLGEDGAFSDAPFRSNVTYCTTRCACHCSSASGGSSACVSPQKT